MVNRDRAKPTFDGKFESSQDDFDSQQLNGQNIGQKTVFR